MTETSETVISLLEILCRSSKLTNEDLDYIPYTNYYVDWNTYEADDTISANRWQRNICHKSNKCLREHLKIINPHITLKIHNLPNPILERLVR